MSLITLLTLRIPKYQSRELLQKLQSSQSIDWESIPLPVLHLTHFVSKRLYQPEFPKLP
jgi:hypothetical protein